MCHVLLISRGLQGHSLLSTRLPASLYVKKDDVRSFLGAHFWRSSFIETQALVENKVDFKAGTIFAADRAVSLECRDKPTLKPRREY